MTEEEYQKRHRRLSANLDDAIKTLRRTQIVVKRIQEELNALDLTYEFGEDDDRQG